MTSLIYGTQFLKKMKQLNLQNRIRLTDIENKFMVTQGETGVRGKSGLGMNIHITIYKIDKLQDLLYGLGNSTITWDNLYEKRIWNK